MTITVISGIRDLDPGAVPDVELAVVEELLRPDVIQLRFGGALGADTAALSAACAASVDHYDVDRVVVVPFKVRDQPREAEDMIEACATEVVELNLPRSRWGPLRRNDRMLAGADRLLAFTDGREAGGTAYTIRQAKRLGLDVEIVPVIASGGLRRENPRLRAQLSGPVYAYLPYVSRFARGPGTDERAAAVTDLIWDMKEGLADPTLVTLLAQRLAGFIQATPELAQADCLAPMPRRSPGVVSDLLPLARQTSALTGQAVLSDWLIRRELPTFGGKFTKGRMRWSADEHARTMSAVYPVTCASVIVLDNVITTTGTTEGALRAVLRDEPSVRPLGLAALYSTDLAVDP